jgi:two-component system, OmpR family, sensor histidine kinase KdpD
MTRADQRGPDLTEPTRPTADALLDRYGFVDRWSTRKRGWLRVLLGAAPGVGKTYAMLREGRRLQEAGRDVVVGHVETHGRLETADQIRELEVIPRRRVSYQGVIVEEMDVDAILVRKPQIALVDELAHGNAPGSPRAKRWQDVDVLRDAGIDVITTMNVQHLESLRDVIAGFTGVDVRETVPDRVLDDAEVQLIDLPTEALIDRLVEGKVYPPQRTQQALAHYFRAGNLTALRELALRHTAAGVDNQLEQYMREAPPHAIRSAADRVLVLLDGDPAGSALRAAWRLAEALRCDLVGVTVRADERDARMSESERQRLARNVQLAEDLGATVIYVGGDDLARALAEAARMERATVVALGYRAATGWTTRWRKTLPDRLRELLDGVDLYLVERRDRDS